MLHSSRLAILCVLLLASLAQAPPGHASQDGPTYDAAFRAMMENPTDLDTTFGYAVIARRAGDLEGAIGALERMLILNPDLPVVHYELARLYDQLGSLEAARRYYQSALRYDPPPDIRADIEARMARLDEAMQASSFSGSASLGIRYRSNANAAPDDPNVLVGGFEARLADEFLDRGDWGTVASARLTHRYDLGRDPTTLIVSAASAYATRQWELEENDTEIVAVTIGPEFTRPTGTSLHPSLSADWATLGGPTFYRSIGVGITARGAFPGSRKLQWTVNTAVLRRNFEESDRSPTIDRRDGESYRMGAEARAAISPKWRIGVSIGWERQNSREKSESHSRGSAGLRLLGAVASPIGDRAWNLAAAAQGSIREYAAPDRTIDPDRRRRDRGRALSVALSIPFADAAAATIEARRDWRRSNLPNFEYEDTSLSAGVRIAF